MSGSKNKSKIFVREVKGRQDIKQVEELAEEIWTQHYTPIIGNKQVRYMLDNFQSFEAIVEQISEGMTYFLMFFQGEPVGYMASKPDDEDLFLSKIYVLSAVRGKGIGGYAMSFLASMAREQGCRHLSLTVNKNNTNSIRTYEKLGFVNLGPLETDIGNGFIMDDFLMKKKL
jgi:ribosomal protein S18 acetylase RimI-like enzyme